ncbi:MAG: hypothetical protein ABW208_29555 [Pyrinomonadaceae bacterium]
MLNALRASVMLLVLVGTTQAGEVLIPPAPQQPPRAPQKWSGEMLYVETASPYVSDSLAAAALELLAILPALV